MNAVIRATTHRLRQKFHYDERASSNTGQICKSSQFLIWKLLRTDASPHGRERKPRSDMIAAEAYSRMS